MKINSLAVFCGSKKGNNDIYTRHAEELGNLLAKNNVTLIYGGGNSGIMGAVANAVLQNEGKVIGIIPKRLVEWEHQHEGITQLAIVDDMHIRKQRMYDLCDAAVIMAGGVGTLDEFFEMVTWNQLSIHDKKIFILNSENFFEHLLQHIRRMEREEFLYESVLERITVIEEPAQLIQYIT